MPVPPAPPPLEIIGAQPFSFHPPLAHAGPNEWRYLRCSWAEVVVVNESTGEEIAVPRRWIGGLADVDGTTIAVELLAALEYRDGSVRRTERRLIVMPVAEDCATAPQASRASVVPIRLQSGLRSRAARIAAAALALAMAACVLVAYLYRGEIIDSRNTVRSSARGF